MTSVRRSSLLQGMVLAALAVCLSTRLASAQDFGEQSRLPGATRGSAPTLHDWSYSSISSSMSLSAKYIPPDPCSPGEWAKWLLSLAESLL